MRSSRTPVVAIAVLATAALTGCTTVTIRTGSRAPSRSEATQSNSWAEVHIVELECGRQLQLFLEHGCEQGGEALLVGRSFARREAEERDGDCPASSSFEARPMRITLDCGFLAAFDDPDGEALSRVPIQTGGIDSGLHLLVDNRRASAAVSSTSRLAWWRPALGGTSETRAHVTFTHDPVPLVVIGVVALVTIAVLAHSEDYTPQLAGTCHETLNRGRLEVFCGAIESFILRGPTAGPAAGAPSSWAPP